MTTNHPAHGPVSLDRLHQIREILSKASAQSDGGNLGYAMADAVKVIDEAIAAFGAEPVLYTAEETLAYAEMGELHLKCLSRPMGDAVIPLYTAPPAKVVPEWTNEQCLEFLSIAFRHAEIKGDLELDDIRLGVKMVNESRDAMLQLYGNSEQLDEVGSWNNHRNTPTAHAGNSPATPDCWIPVSERMPNDKDFVWCYGYVSGWTESDGFEAYYDATRNKWWTVDDETVRKVTHWMPLPAAPQQEVKSALEHGMQRYAGAMQKLSEGDK